MEEKMLSICGLVCTDCPAYKATQTDDRELARKTATEWAQAYGIQVTPDDVWCDGCLVAGRKCAHCAKCEIRACGMERTLAHCGHCTDYPCKTLEGFFAMVPFARDNLDAVRGLK
jgi:hypothetical protein